MVKPNEERWRITVDLGKVFTTLLREMIHSGVLREELGFHKCPSVSRAIRLAVLELARKKLPPEATAAITMYDL